MTERVSVPVEPTEEEAGHGEMPLEHQCCDIIARTMRPNAVNDPAEWETALMLAGDTLSALAEKLGTSVEGMLARNPAEWAKAWLLSAGPEPDGTFGFLMKTPMGPALAEFMAATLKQADAPNFLAVSAHHEELGKLDLIIQRASGETTQERLAAERARRESAEAALRPFEAASKKRGRGRGAAHLVSVRLSDLWPAEDHFATYSESDHG